MSNSLVHVSRQAEWGACEATPWAPRCQEAHHDGAHFIPWSRRRGLHGHDYSSGLGCCPEPRWSTPWVDRWTSSLLFHIRLGHIAGPYPLSSRQFQTLFDSLFKVFFIFPSWYLFAIGLSPVFSLGRNLPPDWGCIPKQSDSLTTPRGAIGSRHDEALTLSSVPNAESYPLDYTSHQWRHHKALLKPQRSYSMVWWVYA